MLLFGVFEVFEVEERIAGFGPFHDVLHVELFFGYVGFVFGEEAHAVHVVGTELVDVCGGASRDVGIDKGCDLFCHLRSFAVNRLHEAAKHLHALIECSAVIQLIDGERELVEGIGLFVGDGAAIRSSPSSCCVNRLMM